ncbi:MAG: sodium:solute symporter [Crocinitomicaceae bacterium]|nr:sodium:solute symporter [Crocinitomicaceae bacterium]
MTPISFLLIALAYVSMLFIIAYFTGGKSKSSDFYLAGKAAPWYIVAFGMIGATLSGVTFISVPGEVVEKNWHYLQMMMGFCTGYIFIMLFLLPLYYKLGLTSIYTYLEKRFGNNAYKTGASFFLLSRTIGASFRLFLVALVVEMAFLDPIFEGKSPTWAFALTVFTVLTIIYFYTKKGGMATVIWTDTIQTACMLAAVILTVYAIAESQGVSIGGIPELVKSSGRTQIFEFENWKAPHHFVKHFLAGVFLCIAMTGLDQDMMQKNLACKDLKSAQKNMGSFAFILFFVNIIFLSLGALFCLHGPIEQISLILPITTDKIYPMFALDGSLGIWMGGVFLVGLLASAFSSADSAMTSLTTSICVDIIGIEKMEEKKALKIRGRVHVLVALVLLVVIMLFRAINDQSAVAALFTAANYTYGPLLGLFFYGIFSKEKASDKFIPIVAITAPVICYILERCLDHFYGFSFGFALLPVNGIITALGLSIISINEVPLKAKFNPKN